MEVTLITSIYIPLARTSLHLAVREAVWSRAQLKLRDSIIKRRGGSRDWEISVTMILHGLTPACLPSLISSSPSLCSDQSRWATFYSSEHSGLMISPLFNLAHTSLCLWDAFYPVHALWIWTFLRSPSHLPSLTRASSSTELHSLLHLSFFSGMLSAHCFTFPQLPQLLHLSGKRQVLCSNLMLP